MSKVSTTIADGTITVHGVGAVHVVQFTSLLKQLADAFTGINSKAFEADPAKAISKVLEKIPLADVFKIVDECCTPRLTEAKASLDTTFVAVAAWLDLSFPRESASPLTAAGRHLIDLAAGAIRVTESALSSMTLASLLPPASEPSPTSSSVAATDGRIPDGHTENAGSGSQLPIANEPATSAKAV